MKAIHKACSKDKLREAQMHFQVKDGKVNATNGWAATISPVVEVFGEFVIEPNEELYFKAEEWQKAKMHQSDKITREGLYFTGYSAKGAVLGTIKAKTEIEGRYPDVQAVFPSEENSTALSTVSFDPQLILDIKEAMGGEPVKLIFTGQTRGIILKNAIYAAKGVVMPLATNF